MATPNSLVWKLAKELFSDKKCCFKLNKLRRLLNLSVIGVIYQ